MNRLKIVGWIFLGNFLIIVLITLLALFAPEFLLGGLMRLVSLFHGN